MKIKRTLGLILEMKTRKSIDESLKMGFVG